jgi:hypothetical protein
MPADAAASGITLEQLHPAGRQKPRTSPSSASLSLSAGMLGHAGSGRVAGPTRVVDGARHDGAEVAAGRRAHVREHRCHGLVLQRPVLLLAPWRWQAGPSSSAWGLYHTFFRVIHLNDALALCWVAPCGTACSWPAHRRQWGARGDACACAASAVALSVAQALRGDMHACARQNARSHRIAAPMRAGTTDPASPRAPSRRVCRQALDLHSRFREGGAAPAGSPQTAASAGGGHGADTPRALRTRRPPARTAQPGLHRPPT